jgi:F-type H+-transporting ATPase subunit delta
MNKLSRRQLAAYAADQLQAGQKAGPLAKELAAVLVASRRQSQARQLTDDIAWELERRGKLANAEVTSARQLSEAIRKQIVVHVKKAAKVETVVVSQTIDRSVIGGLRIDTAAHSWDKTVRRKLTDIRETV